MIMSHVNHPNENLDVMESKNFNKSLGENRERYIYAIITKAKIPKIG